MERTMRFAHATEASFRSAYSAAMLGARHAADLVGTDVVKIIANIFVIYATIYVLLSILASSPILGLLLLVALVATYS